MHKWSFNDMHDTIRKIQINIAYSLSCFNTLFYAQMTENSPANRIHFYDLDDLKERVITPFFYRHGFSFSGIHVIFASIHQVMVDVTNCNANLKMMEGVNKKIPMAL